MNLTGHGGFIVRDTSRFSGQDIYACGTYVTGGFELYYPAVTGGPDMEIEDDRTVFLSRNEYGTLSLQGDLVLVRDADLVPYDPHGLWQADFIDPIYTGTNNDIIVHIQKTEKIYDKYGGTAPYRLPTDEQERTAIHDRAFRELWGRLGDIPFDEMGNGELALAEDWAGFPQGTEREEIWHWFDENYSQGVHALMFPSEHDIPEQAEKQPSLTDWQEATKNQVSQDAADGKDIPAKDAVSTDGPNL